MGFSDVASHGVWFFALLAIAAPLSDDAVHLWDNHHEAREDAVAARFDRRDTTLEIRSFVYDDVAGTLTITVRNAGTVPLVPTKTAVLLDGIPVDATVTVEGVTSDVWNPGEDAAFVVSWSSFDTVAVLVVAPNGVRAYDSYTPPPPPKLHSANVSTYLGSTLTTAFKNGDTATIKVTVHDAVHALVSGATVTVRLDRPDGASETLGPATTDASGVASIDRKFVGGDPDGTYTVTVTSIQKTDYQEDLAASEELSNTFTKSK